MPPHPEKSGTDQCRLPVVVGKISGHYGVKGWVKVYSYTRPVEQILEFDQWLLADQPEATSWQQIEVISGKQQSGRLLAKFAEANDRNSADGLIGKWIAINRSQFAALPQGEYFWSELIGLSVKNQDGFDLGIVDHLVETGANDVLVVRPGSPVEKNSTGNSVERLLPWSPDVIIEVDVDGGMIKVEWDPDF